MKKEALESEGNFLLGTGYSLSLAAHRKGNRKAGFLFRWGEAHQPVRMPDLEWRGRGGYLGSEGECKCKYSDPFEL